MDRLKYHFVDDEAPKSAEYSRSSLADHSPSVACAFPQDVCQRYHHLNGCLMFSRSKSCEDDGSGIAQATLKPKKPTANARRLAERLEESVDKWLMMCFAKCCSSRCCRKLVLVRSPRPIPPKLQ